MIGGVLIRAIVVIVSLVFVVGSWVVTGAPNVSLFSLFSAAVFFCTLLLFTWDQWIWKMSAAQRIRGVSRDVSGTWEATLESHWINPETGTSPAPKTVYLVVRQTSSTASVTLFSDESRSESSLARVVNEKGAWLLHYIYTNEPRLDLRGHSPIHHGSGVLYIAGSPAKRLAGGYWTDRDSKGQLTLTKRSKKIVDDFEEAQEALRDL